MSTGEKGEITTLQEMQLQVDNKKGQFLNGGEGKEKESPRVVKTMKTKAFKVKEHFATNFNLQ